MKESNQQGCAAKSLYFWLSKPEVLLDPVPYVTKGQEALPISPSNPGSKFMPPGLPRHNVQNELKTGFRNHTLIKRQKAGLGKAQFQVRPVWMAILPLLLTS